MEESSWTSGERLQRQVQASTIGIANLIVIGASAGGQRAAVEIFKNLSADMPAAIVLLELPVKNAILDGEIVCLDGAGRSQFNTLLHRRASLGSTHSTYCGSTAKTSENFL